jgi:anti-sigma factor RsiW
MNCPEVRERLTAFLDGELPPAEAEAVRAHVAACAECAVRADEGRAVAEACRAWADREPSDGFAARLAHTARVRARARRWRPFLSAAALLLVGVGLVAVLTRPETRPVDAAKVNGNGTALVLEHAMAAVVAGDADRVEEDGVWTILVGDEMPDPPEVATLAWFAGEGL